MKWEKKTINDLCEIKGGKRVPKNHELIEIETNHPYIRARDIGNGIIDFSKPVYLQESTFNFISRYTVKANDIVLTIVGANIGDVGLIPKHLDGANLTENAVKLTSFNENCHFKYLLYYFLLPGKKKQLEQVAAGSAQGKLGLYKIKDIEVPIPPLPTQRKIASILSAYDDLIENNLKRIKLLEEKACLMYKLMQKELSDVEKINLYAFANIQMGFAFKAEAFNEEGEGIPIIRIRDIPGQMTKSYTTQEVDNQYWVEKGDLLIGMDGEFHMNEWLGQRGYLVQRVCRLRAKNELYQSYLWQALKEPIHYYETTISGATVAHLGKKHLEEIFIASPKDSMKNELEEMNIMRKLKIVLAEQNTKLREARDILLPKLMNGQIEL